MVSANTVLSLPLSDFFVFLFFWSLRHAHRSHWWTDFDDLYVMWRSSAQGSAFWGFIDDRRDHSSVWLSLKAKFHYASWFEAGSKLQRAEIWPIISLASSELARASRFATKFHYAIWFEAGSKLVADRFEVGRRPASNLSATSFEPASNQLA